jgi:hypothetical protein
MVTWDALDALSHAFELNGIGPTSRVIALVGDDDPLAPLVRAALARSHAEALEIHPVRDGADELDRLRRGSLLPSLFAGADIVVDALGATTDLMRRDLTRRTDTTSARLLRLLPAAAEAHLRPPHASLATRVERVAARVASSRTLAVQDENGTDLVVALDSMRLSADGGRANGAGEATEFPSGWITVTPGDGAVDGDLVIMPGDGNLARRTHINSPIRLTVRDDRIIAIDGDNADADVLRALFEAMDTVDAYGMASLSLGLNPGRLAAGRPFDDVLVEAGLARLSAGVVTIAFGDNDHADRPCPDQVGLALSRRTVTLDDTALCDAGELVGDATPDVYELPG